ncbi:MAG: methionine--tRNA ligase [Candidatus Heimdallarchaeota archaeon]
MVEHLPFNTFKKLDLRIGKILSAHRVEGTDHLLKLKIDIGEAQPRESVAGMAAFKSPQELEGKLVPVVTNLQPATIRGITSEVMILAADIKGRPILLYPETEIPPGTKIR